MTLLDKCEFYNALMADPVLTDAARRVAWALMYNFHNTTNGACHPSFESLADKARLKLRATINAVGLLIKREWIRRARGGGRGRANEYELVLERVHRRAPFEGSQRVHDDDNKQCTAVHPNTRRNTRGHL